MTTLAITPAPELNKLTIKLTPEAEGAKAVALAKAEFILIVSDPAAQREAIQVAAELKGFARDVEKAREEVKKPFWDAGKAIDAAAKTAAESVNAEVNRIERLIADYQRKEQEKADAIRREQEQIARELEAKRLAAEREKLRAEQEAFRREQEAIRLAQEAKSAKDRKAAAELAAKLEEERLHREFEEMDKAPPAPIILPPPPIVPKAEGQSVRQEYEYEILDLAALYAAYGTRFVKLEPDRAAIRYYLNTHGAQTNIPGLKVTPVTRVNVRAAR